MKSLILLLIPILFSSCLDNSPGFLEPQPSGIKNIEEFPKKICGNYISKEDEKLTLSKSIIVQWGVEDMELSMYEIDTNDNLFIRNDTLFDIEEGNIIPVEIRNDSVFGSINWSDTVFSLSDKYIARKCKGFYILNEYTKDSVWKVVRMKYDNTGTIEFALINKKKEFLDIKNITSLLDVEMKNDTITDYKLKPTKKEFKQMLLSKKLFTDKEYYKKKN